MNAVPSETSKIRTDRRARILRIAAEEFSRRGRAAVRVDEIARRAKVNKALIYYYYESKNALFTAVLEWMVEQSAPLWGTVQQAGLRDGIKRLLDGPEDNGVDFRRLLVWEGLEHGSPDVNEVDIVLQQRRTHAYQVEVDLIRRAQSNGELDEGLDAEALALTVTLLAMSSRILPQVVPMITGLDADSPQYKAKVESFVVYLLDRCGKGPEV
ncbi:TetR/AcrR family transcriptional regulator [Nocardia fluminea]|uniref:TetR/AcrR family transcriptional regulator n=1 Tax=Nocardia fluminea TaxID=134984 RepID=UPI00341B06BF